MKRSFARGTERRLSRTEISHQVKTRGRRPVAEYNVTFDRDETPSSHPEPLPLPRPGRHHLRPLHGTRGPWRTKFLSLLLLDYVRVQILFSLPYSSCDRVGVSDVDSRVHVSLTTPPGVRSLPTRDLGHNPRVRVSSCSS